MGRTGMERRDFAFQTDSEQDQVPPLSHLPHRDGCELLADPGLSTRGYFCSQPGLTHICSATAHTNAMLRPGLSWAGLGWAGPHGWVGWNTPVLDCCPSKPREMGREKPVQKHPLVLGSIPRRICQPRPPQGWVNSRGTFLAAGWMLQQKISPTCAN